MRVYCRHFEGCSGPTCRAGVLFDTLLKPVANPGRMPCGRADGKTWCQKHDPYTAEEIAEQDRVAMEYANNCMKTRDAITAHVAATKQWYGGIVCPICQGDLQYHKSRQNGHVRAQCKTEGCVYWIE